MVSTDKIGVFIDGGFLAVLTKRVFPNKDGEVLAANYSGESWSLLKAKKKFDEIIGLSEGRKDGSASAIQKQISSNPERDMNFTATRKPSEDNCPDCKVPMIKEMVYELSEERKDGRDVVGEKMACFDQLPASDLHEAASPTHENKKSTRKSSVETFDDGLTRTFSDVSLCPACSAMTHTVSHPKFNTSKAWCGKCGAVKP